ncbi:MAG: hypothetical protein ACQ5SW_10485 [Sphaerochaetaceae bacterium]
MTKFRVGDTTLQTLKKEFGIEYQYQKKVSGVGRLFLNRFWTEERRVLVEVSIIEDGGTCFVRIDNEETVEVFSFVQIEKLYLLVIDRGSLSQSKLPDIDIRIFHDSRLLFNRVFVKNERPCIDSRTSKSSKTKMHRNHIKFYC